MTHDPAFRPSRRTPPRMRGWTARLSAWLVAWLTSVRLQMGALAGIYGVVADGYLLLRIVFGERLVLVAALNNVAHWIVLGSVTSCLVALLAPFRRFWVLYTLPGVVAFVAWYSPLYVPDHWFRSADSDLQLTVATYNLAAVRHDAWRTRNVLLAMEPDVFGLQEVGNGGRTLMVSLQDVYPYMVRDDDLPGSDMPISKRPERLGGYALLSKYPFLDGESRVLLYYPEQAGENGARLGFRVVVDVDGQPVSVYVVHPLRPAITVRPLEYDARARAQGVRVIADALRQEIYPTVLLCDCNFSPQTDDYGVLSGLLTDAWRERGFGLGLTAPADPDDTPLRLMRSDYIWHSAAFTTLQIKVWPDSGASDHRPVWAELGLGRSDSD
jgi:vancomycin resistance protein VanJ